MSRIVIGLAMAVGLVGGAALGQVGGKPEASPGSPPEAAAKSFPGSPGARPDVPARSFPGSPGARPEPAVRSVPSGFGGLGSRPDAVPPRRPSEPPDPRAAMVMVQAVLVELVQDESGTAGGENPPPVRGLRRDAGPGDRPRAPDSPGPIGRADPAPRGKSELGVIDLDLAAPHENILAELRKFGMRGRLDVLNRVQVTTLDKQSAYVQLGRREPVIMGTSRSQFGAANNVTLQSFGLLVSIVPRVSPSDVVVLEIDLSQSRPLPGAAPAMHKEDLEHPHLLLLILRNPLLTEQHQILVLLVLLEQDLEHPRPTHHRRILSLLLLEQHP